MQQEARVTMVKLLKQLSGRTVFPLRADTCQDMEAEDNLQLSTMWILEVALWPPGLAACTFTQIFISSPTLAFREGTVGTSV